MARVEQLLTSDFTNLHLAYPWPDKFWIRANFAQSLNGKVTDKTEQLYLSSEKDKSLFRYLRATSDCILIGRNTVLIEPYQNVRVSEKYLSLRHTTNPIRVAIVSNSLKFPEGFFKKFNQKPLLITNQAAAAKNSVLSKEVDLVLLGETSVELSALTTALNTFGLKRILCEGGARLMTALVNENLLDEIDLTLISRLLPSDEASLFTKDLNPLKVSDFEYQQILFDADNLFLRMLKK